MNIRQAFSDDLPAILDLFERTVKNINIKHYTTAQVSVWVQATQNQAGWQKRIEEQYFLVAEKGLQLTGFASITVTGYVDVLYVHQDFQRQGIAQLLYQALENQARVKNIAILTSDVSITARPFFEKNGFQVLQKQENERQGEVLVNFKMQKLLHVSS